MRTRGERAAAVRDMALAESQRCAVGYDGTRGVETGRARHTELPAVNWRSPNLLSARARAEPINVGCTPR